MGIYYEITGTELPKNCLILPLQYPLFGELHHCVMFVSIQGEIGKGTSKRVEKALVAEVIGKIPVPEVLALKGKEIVLYRPYENHQSFINDIISIVKLGQKQIRDFNLRTNLVKVRGHSMYVIEDYHGTESDYSKLLYEGFLKLTPDNPTLLWILQSALGQSSSMEQSLQLVDEVLQANDLVDTPFMIGDILPYSLYEALPRMEPELILQNVYQMLYTTAAYAAEGVYFRDLQPNNFRVDQKGQVKLIDPSYIDSGVQPENRFMLFIRQTTPEYLPNVFFQLQRMGAPEVAKRYFGEFTEGVCIGMLERVLRKIFMPKYMGGYSTALSSSADPAERVSAADTIKAQEDFDLFRSQVLQIPGPGHFDQYQQNIAAIIEQEGLYPRSIALPIAALITMLRKFSYPVFTETMCRSYLQIQGKAVSVAQLPDLAMALGVTPSKDQVNASIAAKWADGSKVSSSTGRLTMPTRKSLSMITQRLQTVGRTQRRAKKDVDGAMEDVAAEAKHAGTATAGETPIVGRATPVETPPDVPGGAMKKTGFHRIQVGPRDLGPKMPAEQKPLASEAASSAAEPEPSPPQETAPVKIAGFQKFGFSSKTFDTKAASSIAEPEPSPPQETTPVKIAGFQKFGFSSKTPGEKAPAATTPPKDTPEDDAQTAISARRSRKSTEIFSLKAGGEGIPAQKTSAESSPKTANPEEAKTVIEQRNRQKIEMVFDYIQAELSALKKLIAGNETWIGDYLQDLLEVPEVREAYPSINELKAFFKKVEVLLHGQDLDMRLLRQVQRMVPEEVYKDLRQHASQEYRHCYQAGVTAQKCRKIIANYLLRIAKCRFVAMLNLEQNAETVLPDTGDNLLEFICMYESSLHSLQELSDTVIREVLNPAKSRP